MCDFDIVILSEIKTSQAFSLPGFKCVRSALVAKEESRGGVAVLFKHHIWNSGVEIDTGRDQVWFRIRSAPGLYFGAVYITPSDSPFFRQDCFSLIQEKCIQFPGEIVILGDLNARIPLYLY